MIPDFVEDKAATLLVQIAERYTLPDYVKQANMEEVKAVENIAVTAFADPLHKKFACHTPAATWLSAAYFFDNCKPDYHAYNKNVINRLEKFAAYFGIKNDYDTLVKTAADKHNEELPDTDYAYVWQSNTGGKERHYPMTNNLEVKVAASWLTSVQDKLMYQEANTVALKILTKAARYGTALGEFQDPIEKLAGYGIPDVEGIVSGLRYRAQLAKPDLQKQIEKVAESVEKTPKQALQQPQLIKLAATIDEIDYTLNIKGKYGELLQRPVDFIFAVPLSKAAADMSELCELQTGAIFNKTQLSKLALDDLESVLGTEFVQQVSTGLELDPEKMASVSSTLPRGDAELIERLLAEAGQHPQMLDKRASFSLIPEAELEKIASLYSK